MVRKIEIKQPFDMELSLTMGQAGRWYELPPDFYADSHKWFSGVLGENLIHIRQTENGVEYRVGGSYGERDATDKDDDMLLRYFREYDDVQAIYDDISGDPVVKYLVQKYRGMRVLRQDPWECTVSYICSAQNSIPKIRQNVRAISENWGEQVSLCKDSSYTFPGPEQLAKAEASTLQKPRREGGLGLGKSAKFVSTIAKSVASIGIDLEVLRVMDYHQTVRFFERFDGVGPKVSNCIALMSMDKLEAFPVDLWVLRALGQWYSDAPKPQNPKSPNEKEHKEIVEWAHNQFGKYAGYAGQYLFHGINPKKETKSNNYGNRSQPCPRCKAGIGEVCYTPSGYRYDKGHSERNSREGLI